MHITVNSRRRLRAFCLIEPLESRVLLTADPYTAVSSIVMTGSVKNGTGAQPSGLAVAPNGDLYGTTVTGGTLRYGTVYKITGTSSTPTLVASFSGAANGISPRGDIVFDAQGDLLGTTTGGGAHNDGTVWEITAASLAGTAPTITPVHSFAGADGTYPTSGLFPDGSGNFFGYTEGVLGSPLKNRTLVFEVSPSGNTWSVTTVATYGTNLLPSGGLTIDAAGNIYGETHNGGAKHFGTVFEIPAGTSTMVTKGTFNGTDGANPDSTLVIDSSGDIFGTTLVGSPAGDGTIFKIPANDTTGVPTRVVAFDGDNGYRPLGTLILVNDVLYGVTSGGGGGNSPAGTLFSWSINSTSSSPTPQFHFRVGGGHGTTPTGTLLMNSSGQFFGTTFSGGKNNLGTVFTLAPNPP